MARLKLFLPLLVFVLVALFFYSTISRIGSGSFDPQALPSALIDKPVPAFALPQLENTEQIVKASDLHGQVALLNVWATWCPSCYAEHPFLLALAEQGVRIIGLNYKDNSDKAREWLQRGGNPYAFNIVDSEGRLGLDLGVTGAPETYVIDANSIVRFRYQGPLDARVWAEQFQPLLAQMQAEAGAEAQP